jgi:hypothetical protein
MVNEGRVLDEKNYFFRHIRDSIEIEKTKETWSEETDEGYKIHGRENSPKSMLLGCDIGRLSSLGQNKYKPIPPPGMRLI